MESSGSVDQQTLLSSKMGDDGIVAVKQSVEILEELDSKRSLVDSSMSVEKPEVGVEYSNDISLPVGRLPVDNLVPLEKCLCSKNVVSLENSLFSGEDISDKRLQTGRKEIICAKQKDSNSVLDSIEVKELQRRVTEVTAQLGKVTAQIHIKDEIIRQKLDENECMKTKYRNISAKQKEAFIKLRDKAKIIHGDCNILRQQNVALNNKVLELENMKRDFEAFKKGAQERETALKNSIELSNKKNLVTMEALQAQQEAIDDVMKREVIRSRLRVSISNQNSLVNGVMLTAEIPKLDSSDAVNYKWYRSVYADWVPISGAINPSYVINADDIGSMVKVEVRSKIFEDITDSRSTKQAVDIEPKVRELIEDSLRRCLDGKDSLEYPVILVGEKINMNLNHKLLLNKEKLKIRTKEDKTIEKEFWNPNMKVELHPINELQFSITLSSEAKALHFCTNNSSKRDMIVLFIRAFNSYVLMNQKDKFWERSLLLKYLIQQSALMAKQQHRRVSTIEENHPTLTRNALLINRLAPHSSRGIAQKGNNASGYSIKVPPATYSHTIDSLRIDSPNNSELLSEREVDKLFGNPIQRCNSSGKDSKHVVPPIDDEKSEAYEGEDRSVGDVFAGFEAGQPLDDSDSEEDQVAEKCVALKDFAIKETSTAVASDAQLKKFTFTPAPSSSNNRLRKVKKRKKKKKKKRDQTVVPNWDHPKKFPLKTASAPCTNRVSGYNSLPTQKPQSRSVGSFELEEPVLISIVESMHCRIEGTSISIIHVNGEVSIRFPKNTPLNKISKFRCKGLNHLTKHIVNTSRVKVQDDILLVTPPPDCQTCWMIKFQVNKSQTNGKCPLKVVVHSKSKSEECFTVLIKYKVNPKLCSPLKKCSFIITVKEDENSKVELYMSQPTGMWSQEVGKLMWKIEELQPGGNGSMQAEFIHSKTGSEDDAQVPFKAGPLEMSWEIPNYSLSSLDFISSDLSNPLLIKKKLKAGRYSSQ